MADPIRVTASLFCSDRIRLGNGGLELEEDLIAVLEMDAIRM